MHTKQKPIRTQFSDIVTYFYLREMVETCLNLVSFVVNMSPYQISISSKAGRHSMALKYFFSFKYISYIKI